jgi:hypothetical protein
VPPAFAGPQDFQGSFTPRIDPVTAGLQSTYTGAVVVTEVERAVVQQMLPAGLSLAPPKAPAGTKHPVIHLIGQQRSPRTFPVDLVPPGAAGYDEMILFVPFVVKANATLWHNYIVRMYLTDDIAVFGGNQVYGYQKLIAALPRTEAAGAVSYTVSQGNPAVLVFRTDMAAPQPPVAGLSAGTLSRWPDISRILEMPFLGVRTDGVQVCSHWELDYGNATIAETSSKHQVFHAFRPGMEPWETMGPLRSAPHGAFVMSGVRWRLAFPPPPVQGC